MRPDFSPHSSIGAAVRKGLHSARLNLPVMATLLAAMSFIVAAYYTSPRAADLLSWYADWMHAGGIFRVALMAGFAGGVLSEASLVYIRDRGRWTTHHLENMLFRFVIFFFGGMIVTKFYDLQAVWFGHGTSWSVILPKVLVDQFVFSVFWSTTYQSITFRWQALRYSTSKLWSELNWDFVLERMLPILVTNWMFWIPGVTLIYAMPLLLQMPLNIFATAIWSILLATLSKPAEATSEEPETEPLVP